VRAWYNRDTERSKITKQASRLADAKREPSGKRLTRFELVYNHDVKKRLSLSSTGLKIIAMLTMAIDHIGVLFFPGDLMWRVIGRISFPIFALLIAEGFERTGNVRNYLIRLLAFAAISQVPYRLFLQAANQPIEKLNIFFTLAAGLFSLLLLKKLIPVHAWLGVFGIAAAAQYLNFDYGAYGVFLVLVSALFLRTREVGIFLLFVLHTFQTVWVFLIGQLSIQIYAALSVPFVALYNRERGRELHRLLLYGFYPMHLLVLLLIWIFLN